MFKLLFHFKEIAYWYHYFHCAFFFQTCVIYSMTQSIQTFLKCIVYSTPIVGGVERVEQVKIITRHLLCFILKALALNGKPEVVT